jgi:hypothetical protein
MAESWKIKGDWFDVCRCSIPCPCSWAQPPDDDLCQGILLWHIRQGNYGKVKLDGLSMAMLGTFKGAIWEGKATEMAQAFFMDERADEAQRGAMQTIFTGQAGGWPAEFGALLKGSETKGMEFAPIKVEFAPDLSSWRAEVPGKFKAAAEALRGPTSQGKNVEIRNLPGAETGPGGVAIYGKATADRVDAFGFKWDRTGKSSKLISFEWSGP